MRVIRYLKHAKAAVALIILLLIVQAFSDLALPRYTSDIVDVGIQQSGVEHVSPEQMQNDTRELALILANQDQRALIEQSYHAEGEGAQVTFSLTQQGKDQREALDKALMMPMALRYQLSQLNQTDVEALAQTYGGGASTQQNIESLIAQARDSFAEMDESLIEQQAVLGTKAEYESLGYDMGSMQMSYLLRVGLQMAGIAAIGMIAAIIIGYVASRTAAGIGQRLRTQLFSKVVSFSDAEVQGFSAASLITRGTNDIQQIQNVTVMLLRMLLYAPILAIGGIIMISQTNLQMSWIIVLAVVLVLVIVIFLMRIAMPKFKLVQKLIDRVNLVSRELLTGVSVIRVFDRQEHEDERFDEANIDLMKVQLFTNRVMVFMMPLMMMIMNATSVLIVWVGASYIDMGTLQTGDLIAFITYAMVIIMSFLMIAMMAIMLPRADVAAQRVNEVLAVEPTIADPKTNRDDEIVSSRGATLSFKDVTFAYPDSEKPVLSGLDFDAKPGETTAIIGSTGSGKSTVVKLIERFYDVSEGSIALDGVDIRELSQQELRENIGYVPQKAFLFTGTIETNVGYSGRANNDQILQAIEIAQASEFVSSKEEGLESAISQGGTNVSGGQRQRLSIARALATDARIYVFDDSFSALDYKTDATLRRALKTQLDDKTIIIIAQRLSTIMDAEQIVVIDEGKIVGKGTHEQLLQSCEEYREIAYSQLSPEELEGGESCGR